MKILFYIIIVSTFNCYSQDKVNLLLNKVVSDIIPEKYNFFFLVQESLNEKKAFDSLKIESPNDLILRRNPDLQKDLLGKVENTTVNWKDYNLNKAKYITKDLTSKFICNDYDLYFVNSKISEDSLSSINKNIGIKTLVVRKSKKWSKKRVWEEIYKVWQDNILKKVEQNKCYELSFPIFSKDGKYARISLFEHRIGGGNSIVYIYKYENDNWKFLAEFNNYETSVIRTHVSCDQLQVNIIN